MKKTLCFFLLCSFAILYSCQKENSLQTLVTGSLVKNTGGDCMPITVGGSFNAGQPVTIANYLDIQVDYNADGGYQISSDTINGYYFYAQGFTDSGVHTIRLQAHGTPVSNETDAFTITLASTSCEADVFVGLPVIPPPPVAVFTLGVTAGNCTGAVLSGTYTAGTAMTGSNTVSLNINATATGAYSITTPTVNGVSFSSSGTISVTGPGTIVLTASGTGTVPATSTYPVTAGSSTCNFAVIFN
jgi:hypothetical protein